jgi:hypothetical protein
MMNPTIKEFHKYLDNRVGWKRRDDSFQARAKASVGHRPAAEPRPECLILGVVRNRPLSPGACAFHDSPLRPSMSTK